MSEESPPEIEAPAVGATVVRYREGWGVLGGILGLSVIPALILGYIFFPSMRSEGFYPVVAWVFFGFFALIPLFGIPVGLAMVAKSTILYIDETGIWWDAGTYFAVVRWSGIRFVRGHASDKSGESDGKSYFKSGNIEIYFFEGAVEDNHRALRPIEYERSSRTPTSSSFGRVLELPRSGIQRRVLAAARSYRSDLIM